MKTIYYILILILLCPGAAFAQSQLFDKYAGMDNVTSVYISKAMFQMMPAIGNIGLSMANMKGKVESLQLVSSDNPDQIPQMRKEFTQLVNSKHQELMRIRDGKKRITFYATMNGDLVKDLFMLADTDSSFTVIQVLGNFTLKDIQEMGKEEGGTK